MADKSSNAANTIMSWGLAALLGGIAFVLLVLFGTSIVGSIFLGGLLFLVLGGAFAWLFLSPLPEPGKAARDAAEAMAKAPSSAPTAPASAEPTAPESEVKATPAPIAADGMRTDAPAPAVKPSAPLAGQEELASRKGTWRYGQDADATSDTPATGTKPKLMDGPREGGADDLKQIKGIGPKLETLCHDLGVYHFDQIAAWTGDEVAWVDANLEGFKGRVTRDEWVSQAKVLAAGGETDFSKKAGDGGVYD